MSRLIERIWVTAQVVWARNVNRTGFGDASALNWLDVLFMFWHSLTRSNQLWLSKQYMDTAGIRPGLDFAHRNVPASQRPGINLLMANAAFGDDGDWIDAVNKYLDCFSTPPIALSTGHKKRFKRLCKDGQLENIEGGDLISVIMPVYNSMNTVKYSMLSVLEQTWKNIELIVVDDCSEDETWKVINEVASNDCRVKILRNVINVGPYVSKNIGLQMASGVYLTGQDADDWAHPQRLHMDVEALKNSRGKTKAVLSNMVRMNEYGRFFTNPHPKGAMYLPASISLLIETNWFRENLGAWDSVRFGADTELIARAERLLGSEFARSDRIGMVCLELGTSLSSDSVHGVSSFRRVSPVRQKYRSSFSEWHKELGRSESKLPFPPISRRFKAPDVMNVPMEDIEKNIYIHNVFKKVPGS